MTTSVTAPAVPAAARSLIEIWHKAECWIAVFAFALIAILLLIDVVGRELLAPLLRLMDFKVGALGLQGSQQVSVYALVIGSYAGIGIATATNSHLVPRVGFGWIPAAWGLAMDRIADVITGVFLIAVGVFAVRFVHSSMTAGLLMPVISLPVWPVQLVMPLGFFSASVRYFCFALWPALRPAPPEFQE